MDDVASGARRYLAALPAVTSVVGAFSASDPVVANRNLPWIFKDDILVTMEGTSSAAIVLSSGGGWSVPQPLTTPRFRRLFVTVYVDALRDSGRNVTETSGATKKRGEGVFDALYGVLQFTDQPDKLWGDLRVVGSELLSDVSAWTQVIDGDWLLTAQAVYGVLTFGDTGGIA